MGRASLDGSDPEILVSGIGSPQDIALDLSSGKMIWGDLWDATVRRANLDGSGVEDLITGLSFPRGVALDFHRLFVDGFESGDTSRWESVAP